MICCSVCKFDFIGIRITLSDIYLPNYLKEENMYHITDDNRSLKSAELIYNGLLQCLDTKSFDQITISDIQRKSSVARTTFYRCFDNISDILYWRCNQCFNEALNIIKNSAPDERTLVRHYFMYWTSHSDILNLLVKINRQDIIYSCHLNTAQELEHKFGTLLGLDRLNAKYFIAIRTGITIGVLKAWIDGGQKETCDELLKILETQYKLLSSRK